MVILRHSFRFEIPLRRHALFKERRLLEWPRGFRLKVPGGVFGKERARPFEVIRVIGAEVQVSAGDGALGEEVEAGGLDEAVLVVLLLRPRIRVEDEDLAEYDRGRERFEELRRLGFQEDDVVEFAQRLLAHGAFDAVRDQVDAHAKFAWMRAAWLVPLLLHPLLLHSSTTGCIWPHPSC